MFVVINAYYCITAAIAMLYDATIQDDTCYKHIHKSVIVSSVVVLDHRGLGLLGQKNHPKTSFLLPACPPARQPARLPA